MTLSGSSQAIVGFALRQGYILLSGASGTARNNLVGMTATGSSADDSSACLRHRVLGERRDDPQQLRDGQQLGDPQRRRRHGLDRSRSTKWRARASGHTNTFDGILLINGASSVQIVANLVRDQRGGGIELGFGAATDAYTNVQVTNNTVQNNGFDSGSTPSTERLGMVGYNYTGSNVVFSRNRVLNNGGPGPGAAERQRHDHQPEQLQLERRRRCDQRPGDRPGSEHARPELARHAERRDDQRRERRGHRAERPAELSGHHLGDHRQRRAVDRRLRAAGQRDRAVRARRRIRAASARDSPIWRRSPKAPPAT